MSEGSEEKLGMEEDEDEDVDFNPFLKEALSPEASSSLSSDNDGLGGNVGGSSASKEVDLVSNSNNVEGSRGLGNEEEQEVVMQGQIQGASGKESEGEGDVNERVKKRKSASLSSGLCSGSKETDPMKQKNLSIGIEDVDVRNFVDLDDEDAICRRTRARYSLANFTLDELETFLQETDDEDDLQNVDDDQEYRKFLAAVLQGGENDGQVNKESENVDDEDEDNDVDFEVEIEEALESDRDESTRYEERKGKYGGSRRRPETRQNKRQKTPCQDQKFLGQANRPLRPILPCLPNGCVAPPPSHDWQKLVPGSTFCYPSSSMQPGVATGFTPHQIGQLHCLIHEHAQLLVQVFSLCVLDTSRQETANAVQQLISGLIHRRNEVLSWRKVPYPDYVFRPPHVHPSVSDEHSKILCTVESSSASGLQKDGPGMMPISLSSHSSEGRSLELGQGYQCQTAVGSPWMPQIGGPLLSVLDAAPLSLLTSYMNDVYKAVQEYKQRNVESLFDSPLEREPLFPLSSILSSTDSLRGATSQGPSTSTLSLPGQQKPKKTLAAALVENTKKQSVAVAPKKIVKLAERFYPLFNSALFPHKPPPPAVANRVLFTDTEDELLAMGLMEYNTDWKAIQQRFLPCKSKHQIFVRQKNRCSSKAPENPIKAVRRMKTSPLSAEEKARIHEGLRVLKLDWMSVWKLIVPHRDPTLLPRQWRIALGTQKSYKSDEAKREKRRLYESNRRKCKAAASASWQTASEKEDYLVNNVAEGNKSGDDNMDDEDEAYVHEAFLSDWKPGSSTYASSEYPLSGIGRRELQPGSVFPPEDTCVGEVVAGNGHVQQQPTDNGYTHDFLFSNFSNHLQNASQFTHVRYSASYTMASNHFSPDLLSKPPKNQVHLRPYRARRKKDAKLVKLAPDLPPVNLPPSVRVISQSAFKTYHCVKSHSTKTLGTDVETENLVPRAGHFPSSLTSCSGNSVKNGTCEYPSTVDLDPQDSTLHLDRIASEEKDAETDLEMHPLLFQAPEDRRLPYCTVDSSTSASGTLNFLPENQLQANFSHYIKPHDAGSSVDHFYTSLRPKEKSSSSCTIDFHPLLQKSDDLYKDSVIASDRQISVVSESFQGHFSQFRNSAITNDKTSELDLEIHLSSSSRKDKNSYNGSRLDMNGGNTKENQKGPFQLSRDDSPTFLMAGGASKQGHILGDSVLVSPSNNISNYMEDNIGDQSLQEIVMEHEELSDSEDEIGEHVEFECEEMADSEGEESESEQLVNIRGLPSVTVKGDNKTSGICKDQQCEPKISSCSKDVACTATKEIIGSHKLGSTSRGKDLSKPSLQLSLDTAANQSKPKQRSDGKDDGGQAGKTLSSRSNRSSKRTMHNSKAAVPKQTSQLWLRNAEADTIVKPARKPRKQACKNSSAIATSGNFGCASSTNLVDCHDNDSCLRVNDVSKNVADIPPSDGKGQENIGSDS